MTGSPTSNAGRVTSRSILGIMREAVTRAELPGATVQVELSRRYGRRRYMISYLSPLVAGHVALFDATNGSLWVRPESPSERYPERLGVILTTQLREQLDQLRAIQATGTPEYPDAYAATEAHRSYLVTPQE